VLGEFQRTRAPNALRSTRHQCNFSSQSAQIILASAIRINIANIAS
jgi:hypothetical protein